MNVYKFKDKTDGFFSFIIARNKDEATTLLESKTSLPFDMVDEKPVENIKGAWFLFSGILPF